MHVVTGMHRSGTSLVAMTLEALGADFGDHDAFYAADQWNQNGYFERRDVMDLNSRLITGFPRTGGPLVSGLSQVRYMAQPSRAAIARRGRRLRTQVDSLAGGLVGVTVKDPRFVLTMKHWGDHTESTVVCLRHPLEVARSLLRRQHVPLRLGLRFWEYHARALLGDEFERALFIRFNRIAGDEAVVELRRLIDHLGGQLSEADALDRFHSRFSPDLRHYVVDGEDLPSTTAKLWSALLERTEGQ